MKTTRTPDQLAYPGRLQLIDRETGRVYAVEAIPAIVEPDIERDIGACCYLGDQARPRYLVDGIERPDFDPTIPVDLRQAGWFWHGGWLAQEPAPNGAGIAIGMPKADLAEVWAAARKVTAVQVEHRAARARDDEKKASRPSKKTQQKPTTPPKEIKAQAPPPAVVVVVKDYQPAVEQLAMW